MIQDAIRLQEMYRSSILGWVYEIKKKVDYLGSGIVVLMMAIKNTKTPNILEDKRVVWSCLIIEMCEYCKSNVLEYNMVNHPGSCGNINSFGYQGVFKEIKNSSVGLYGVRKRFEDERQEDVENIILIVFPMIVIWRDSCIYSPIQYRASIWCWSPVFLSSSTYDWIFPDYRHQSRKIYQPSW